MPYGTVGGRTAIGVEAAAVTFFNKHAKGLRLYQSALLAGLPQAPSEYNPFRNPAGSPRSDATRCSGRWSRTGTSPRPRGSRASQRGLGLRPGTRYIQRREPYFFDYVQDKLIDRYGVGVVRRGGLRIHTTIDPALQDSGARGDQLVLRRPRRPELGARRHRPGDREDQGDGFERDLSAQQVQPGRAGPPPAGLGVQDIRAHHGDPARGWTPDSTYYTSKPLNIDDPDYGHWEVKTFGNSYIGTVSLTRATLSSDNTVYAQLILDLGPKKVCETAKLLGITTQLDCYPAEGLGGLTLRRHPAGDGGRVRDPREWRHPSPPDRHRAGRVPGRQEREPRQRGGQARADGRRGVRGHQGPQDERPVGHGDRRQLRLPGGRQDRHDRRGEGRLVRRLHARSSQPRCGSATRTPASRCRAPRAAPTRRPVWHAFMLPAHGDYCDDFPEPTEPAEFSPFFGKYSSTGSVRTAAVLRADAPAAAPRTDQQYDPRFYEEAPLDAPADRDAARAGGARGTDARERERERQRERRRTAPPRPADAGPVGELDLIAAIEATLSRPQRAARPLDRRRRGRHARAAASP